MEDPALSSLQPSPFPVITPHPMLLLLSLLFLSCSSLPFAQAQVTIYGQAALGLLTSTATPTSTPAAYNNTLLVPPQIPSPAPANVFTLSLQQGAAGINGLSIPHVGGSFWGFSIEMSVISQVRKSISSTLKTSSISFYNLFLLCFSWQKLVCVQVRSSSTIKHLKISCFIIVRLYQYLSST